MSSPAVCISPRVRGREDCLTVCPDCLSALEPYLASFLTYLNLESTVGQLRVNLGRRECESRF